MESVIKGNPFYHLFKFRRFVANTGSTSIAKNGCRGLLPAAFTHTTASGNIVPYSMIQEIEGQEYIAIALRGFYSGNGNLSFRQIQLLYPYLDGDEDYMIVVRNSSTSAQSNKQVTLDVIFMKKPQDAMIYEVVDGRFAKRVNNIDGTRSLVVIDNGE